MNQNKTEQDFERYLEGESDISANYKKASSEQVPKHLDEAILAASRRQVKSGPRYAFSPFASNWQVPLSIAAVLVLSVSVFVNMQVEEEDIYLKSPTSNTTFSDAIPVNPDFPLSEAQKEFVILKDQAEPYDDTGQNRTNAVFTEDAVTQGFAAEMDATLESRERIDKKFLKKESTFSSGTGKSSDSSGSVQNEAAPVSFAPKPAAIQAVEESEVMLKSNEIDRQDAPARQEMFKDEIAIESKKKLAEESKLRVRLKSINRADMDMMASDPAPKTMSVLTEYPPSVNQWIERIKQLWIEGEEENALQQLRYFYRQFPDYPEDKLANILESRLLESFKSER